MGFLSRGEKEMNEIIEIVEKGTVEKVSTMTSRFYSIILKILEQRSLSLLNLVAYTM